MLSIAESMIGGTFAPILCLRASFSSQNQGSENLPIDEEVFVPRQTWQMVEWCQGKGFTVEKKPRSKKLEIDTYQSIKIFEPGGGVLAANHIFSFVLQNSPCMENDCDVSWPQRSRGVK